MMALADTGKKEAPSQAPPPPEFTKSFRFVSYKGKRIGIVDFGYTTPAEAIAVMVEAQAQIRKMPPKSALILTDATHAVYNKASAAALKEFSRGNTPYVKASAVVGVEGVLWILMQAVIRVTGRHYQLCKTRTEAMEWLISRQAADEGP